MLFASKFAETATTTSQRCITFAPNLSSIEGLLVSDRVYRQPAYFDNDTEQTLISYPARESVYIKCIELDEFEFPTLVPSSNFKRPASFVFDLAFYHKYPELVDLDFTNVLIAGGSVSSIFTGSTAKDVDMFIYGLNEEETMAKVKYICDFLEKKIRTHHCQEIITAHGRMRECTDKCPYPVKEFTITRTQHTITVCDTFQIICSRAYKSKHQILRGFDLGSCAIGFDGEQLLFTELGLFAHVFGYNIVDVTRCGVAYEHRLMKYFDRGFGVILPNLNMTNLEEYGTISLSSGKIEITNHSFTGNRICGEFSLLTRKAMIKSSLSDYNQFKYDNDTAIRHNMRILRRNGDPESMFYTGKCVNDVFDIEALKSSMITTPNVERVIRNLVGNSSETVNIATLEEYFTDADIINLLFNRHDANIYKMLIDNLVKRTCAKLIECASAMDLSKMRWITVENGAFNPVTIDAETWYAPHYGENVAVKPRSSSGCENIATDGAAVADPTAAAVLENIRGRLKDVAVKIDLFITSGGCGPKATEITGPFAQLIAQFIKLQVTSAYDDDVYKHINTLEDEIDRLLLVLNEAQSVKKSWW